MFNLPLDITFNILGRLTLKSLSQCIWVCKSWYNIIYHARFTPFIRNLQDDKNPKRILSSSSSLLYSVNSACEVTKPLGLQRPTKTVGSTIIVGSCNGLICLSDYQTFVSVWNPITTQNLMFPYNYADLGFGFDSLGFGYDSLTNEYKVASIPHSSVDQAMVYTTKPNSSWRNIQGKPLGLMSARAVHLNEALHWSCYPYQIPCVITSFCLKTEKFNSIPYPPNMTDYSQDVLALGDLQGCLSLCIYCRKNVPQRVDVDVWQMKDYGRIESWIKLFSIGPPDMIESGRTLTRLQPLFIQKNGQLLFLMNFETLVSYDPVIAKASIRGRIPGRALEFLSVESLTSLVPFMI